MSGIPLAVLIDGENVAASRLPLIMARAAKLGQPSARSVVGDFSGNRLAEWVKVAPAHALELVFQPSCGKGRNSADIALTIRAMDLLGTNAFRQFLIVSSDSDFAPLAQRLGRSGVAVFGMGSARQDSLWRAACTAFFDLDGSPAEAPTAKVIARPAVSKPPVGKLAAAKPEVAKSVMVNTPAGKPQPPVARPAPSRQDLDAVRGILAQATGVEAPWLPLSRLGVLIHQNAPQLGALVCGNGRLLKTLQADSLVEVRTLEKRHEARVRTQACSKLAPIAVPATTLAAGAIA
ncbi:NYN domain-containing protein [Aquibium carbonis]|nr:NYN domain-containing protein [Aquibium carbonis]